MRAALALVVIALAAGCAAPHCEPQYPERDPGAPFLWAVQGNSGSAVLFGTFHAAEPDDIPEQAWDLLRQADVFVAEADEIEPHHVQNGEITNDAFNLPAGRSMKAEMPRDDFERLAYRLEASEASVDRMKPWVSLGLMIKTVYTFPFPNMSAALLTAARKRELRTDFLDTWDQQVEFLDATVGVDDLIGAIRAYDRVACDVGDDVRRYRAGDAAVAKGGSTEPDDPRLARWTNRIVEYLDSGQRAFVASWSRRSRRLPDDYQCQTWSYPANSLGRPERDTGLMPSTRSVRSRPRAAASSSTT
jgi:uncharacterized protein YbaP (TraB family)